MDNGTASDEFVEDEKKDSLKSVTVDVEADSVKEIEDERSDSTRTKVKIVVQMGNEVLRKPLNLSDKYPTECAELYLEMLPKIVFDMVDEEAGEEAQEPIIRQTFDQGVQVTVMHENREMQTLTNKLLNAWTQYEPRLYSDEESIQILNSSTIKSFLHDTQQRAQRSLIENVVADNFFFDINSLCPEDCEPTEEKTLLIENMSFTCALQFDFKMISCLSWHPIYKGVFVASTVQTCKYEDKLEGLSEFVLIPCLYYMWSIDDQTVPRLLLESFDEIRTIQFSPTMPHIIAGGGAHGQLILWDVSKHCKSMDKQNKDSLSSQPVSYTPNALSGKEETLNSPVITSSACSSVHHSHLNGTYHLEWIPPHFEVKAKGKIHIKATEKSYQLVTCGFDGALRFWDLRFDPELKSDNIDSNQYQHLNGPWRPFHYIELIAEGKKHLSITTFSLRAYGGIEDPERQKAEKLIEERLEDSDLDELAPSENASYTEFCAGTEEGEVCCGSFELVRDKTGKYSVKPVDFYTSLHGVSVHGGPVQKIAYSPFIDDIFFSIGGHSLAIWKQEMQRKPMLFKVFDVNITTGVWSRTKPSVFIVGFDNGTIAIWNILLSSRQPIHTQAVTTSPIKVISIHKLSESEQILAVGDFDGIAHILTFPNVLWNPVENELSLVREFFDREIKRVSKEMEKQDLIEAEKVAEAKRLEESAKKKKEKPKMAVEKAAVDDEEKIFRTLYGNFSMLQKEQMEELGYWHQDETEEDIE